MHPPLAPHGGSVEPGPPGGTGETKCPSEERLEKGRALQAVHLETEM